MPRRKVSRVDLEFVKRAGIALFISDHVFEHVKKEKKEVHPKRSVCTWLSKEEYNKLLKAVELSPFPNFNAFFKAVVESLVESLRKLEAEHIPNAAKSLRENHLEEIFLFKRPALLRKYSLLKEEIVEPYYHIKIPLDYDDYLLLKKYFNPTGFFLKSYIMRAVDLILNSHNG